VCKEFRSGQGAIAIFYLGLSSIELLISNTRKRGTSGVADDWGLVGHHLLEMSASFVMSFSSPLLSTYISTFGSLAWPPLRIMLLLYVEFTFGSISFQMETDGTHPSPLSTVLEKCRYWF